MDTRTQRIWRGQKCWRSGRRMSSCSDGFARFHWIKIVHTLLLSWVTHYEFCKRALLSSLELHVLILIMSIWVSNSSSNWVTRAQNALLIMSYSCTMSIWVSNSWSNWVTRAQNALLIMSSSCTISIWVGNSWSNWVICAQNALLTMSYSYTMSIWVSDLLSNWVTRAQNALLIMHLSHSLKLSCAVNIYK